MWFWSDWLGPVLYQPNIPLDVSDLQTCLDKEIEPFFSFDYIYHARNFEDNANRKWILATIALEYAIKEFLMGRDPIFESFIFDKERNGRTSISALYNRIYDTLKSEGISLCLGKDDFKISTEIRNFLIHRPKKREKYLEIESDQVEIYTYFANLTMGQLFAHLNREIPYYSDMMISPDTLNVKFPLTELQDKMNKIRR